MEETYEVVRARAQRQANDSGYDYGVEKLSTWRCFLLPRRENRYGHELRCEAVHPENLSKCKPGHGPVMR